MYVYMYNSMIYNKDILYDQDRSETKIVNKTKGICTNSRLWQCFALLSFS